MIHLNSGVESALDKMIQNRNAFLNGEQPSKNEVEIVPEIVCPALVDEKLPNFLNVDASVAVPDNPIDLNNYMAVQEGAGELGKTLLKKLKIQGKCYIHVLQKTQKHAENTLDAGLKLGQYLKQLPTQQGKRTDLKLPDDDVGKCKKEILEELGITERVSWDLQKLTPEAVEKAKKQAIKDGKIVNRAMALKIVGKQHYKRNNVPEDFKGEFGKRPDFNTFIGKQPLYYTQCFASVGVGEEKLAQIGLFPSVVNELEEIRCRWYRERHKNAEVIQGSIDDPVIFEKIVVAHLKHKNKLILASPVCRDFSIAGKRNFDNPRARLIFPVLELARRVNDVNEYILIENVPGFLTASPENWPEVNGEEKINLGTYVKRELEKLGYIVNIAVVFGCDYNTAQKRRRAFILASKKGKWLFPEKDEQWKTLMDVIGHLPSLNNPGDTSKYKWHDFPNGIDEETIKVLRETPTGCSAQDNEEEFQPRKKDGSRSGAKFQSYNMRNCWGLPAATVMQHNGNPGGHKTIHPGRPLSDGTWTDPRPFSILEILLITGLDANYFIPDWATEELIRNILGDCLLPNVNLALCSMIPGRE